MHKCVCCGLRVEGISGLFDMRLRADNLTKLIEDALRPYINQEKSPVTVLEVKGRVSLMVSEEEVSGPMVGSEGKHGCLCQVSSPMVGSEGKHGCLCQVKASVKYKIYHIIRGVFDSKLRLPPGVI